MTPMWERFPEVRDIVIPLMAKIEAVSLDYCAVIRIDPDKTLSVDDTSLWYEAILSASPEVISEFDEDNRDGVPTGVAVDVAGTDEAAQRKPGSGDIGAHGDGAGVNARRSSASL